MSTSPLGFTYLSSSQTSPELVINNNLAIDDIMARGVIAMDIATPPGSPADGDAYIVAGTATGVWTGHEDEIAYWFDESGIWKFITPVVGLRLYVDDESADFRYLGGSSSWVVVAGTGTVTEVTATGAVSGLTLSHTGTADVEITLGGTLAVAVADIADSTTDALGVGSLEVGHATDTTLARASAGDLNIEGNIIYRAGGTDIPVTDGGTGRSTSTTAYGLIAAGTTATSAHQTLAAGATTDLLVGGGASALPAWTAATGSGAPVRATSPTMAIKAARADIDSTSGTVIDWATDFHTRAISGNTTYTFSNVPASIGAFVAVRITLTGLPTITWPAAVVPADAAFPSLVSGKTYIFCFMTDDGGTTVRATVREFAS